MNGAGCRISNPEYFNWGPTNRLISEASELQVSRCTVLGGRAPGQKVSRLGLILAGFSKMCLCIQDKESVALFPVNNPRIWKRFMV
jgi:hypothetical protein